MNKPMITIRQANKPDVPELAALYRQTVLAHAPQFYTPEQVKTWASFGANTRRFRRFILEVTTFVAVDDTGILGFSGVGEDGHVASVYVRHDCVRQGIGSRLMQEVLRHAKQKNIPRLYAEASPFSLGLFIKFGFHRYATETIDRNGIRFERYLVERRGEEVRE
jgi:putative acetyltransferase